MHLRDIKKNIVRGTKVGIRTTTDETALHGREMFVASHGIVACKQDGRCADDAKCNGYAVFVSAEDRTKVEVEGGWRKGTNKLCLTHVTLDGEPLIRARGATTAEPAESEAEGPEVAEADGPVTWEQLAQAAQEAEAKCGKRGAAAVAQLILLSRRLKSEDERMTKLLVQTQSELLKIQTQALEAVTEHLAPRTEEKQTEEPAPVLGFHVTPTPEEPSPEPVPQAEEPVEVPTTVE